MNNILEFKKPEITWVVRLCECGGAIFYLLLDGTVACAMCERVMPGLILEDDVV